MSHYIPVFIGSIFKISLDEALTFEENIQFCERAGAHPLLINTQHDFDVVSIWLSGQELENNWNFLYFWTGMHYDRKV